MWGRAWVERLPCKIFNEQSCTSTTTSLPTTLHFYCLFWVSHFNYGMSQSWNTAPTMSCILQIATFPASLDLLNFYLPILLWSLSNSWGVPLRIPEMQFLVQFIACAEVSLKECWTVCKFVDVNLCCAMLTLRKKNKLMISTTRFRNAVHSVEYLWVEN